MLLAGIIANHLTLDQFWNMNIQWDDLIQMILLLVSVIVCIYLYPVNIGCISLSSLMFVVFAIIILLSNLISKGYIAHQTYLLVFPLIYSIALFQVFNQVRSINYNKYLFTAIFISVFIELIYIGLQYSGLIINSNHTYKIGGSFGHPGYTACLMSLSVSILAYIMENRRHLRSLVYIIHGLVLISSIILESRTGILISLMTTVGILSPIIQLKFNKDLKWLLSTISITIAIFVAMLFKYSSTVGRTFIWRNCLSMILKKPLFGYGVGSFEREYNSFQTEVLKFSIDSDRKQLADHIQIAYNDFLEIGVETGIVGLTLFLFFWIFIFHENYKSGHLETANEFPIYYPLLGFVLAMCTWSIMKLLPYTILLSTLLIYSKYKTINKDIKNGYIS